MIDFTWYLRNLLLLKSSDEMSEALDMSSENMEKLKEEAGQMEEETIIRYIRIFSELSNQIKYSTQKRILLEIALIKLCRPQMEQDYSSIIGRLEQLEKRIEQSVPVMAANSSLWYKKSQCCQKQFRKKWNRQSKTGGTSYLPCRDYQKAI